MARRREKAPEIPEWAELLVPDAGPGLQIWRVPLEKLTEQPKNARSMNPSTFDRLSANIKKEGRLEEPPFCAWREGRLEIVSGHHRIRAGRSAGLTHTLVVVDIRGLRRSAVVAKQLAHNAIAGVDDPHILKDLFLEITEPDDQLESHIDLADLELASLPNPPLFDVAVDLSFRHVLLLFLPSGMEDFKAVLHLLSGEEQMIALCDIDLLPKFREAVTRVSKVHDIRAIGAVVSKMCDVVLERVEEPEEDPS